MARYIQIFSMTDHSKPLNDRYKGPYQGINADLQTSEFGNGVLHVSEKAQAPNGTSFEAALHQSKVIVAYRHTDTGVLSGTSESLWPLSDLPWTEMPGLSVIEILPKEEVRLKLWDQEMKLVPGHVSRIHFGKTIVYLKNFGEVDSIQWTDQKLENGPRHLHTQPIDKDLTIAPPSGSALQVKMGQETKQ